MAAQSKPRPRKGAPQTEAQKKRNAKMGRSARGADGRVKAWKPTKAQRMVVSAAALAGISMDTVATVLRKDPATVRKHCAEEIKDGAEGVHLKLVGELYHMAMDRKSGKQLGAVIFSLKSKFGYRETQNIDLKGRVQVDMNVNYGEPVAAAN